MNLAELAVNNLKTGEHVNYIFEGREYTNVEMDRAARKLGNALIKLGVKKGDRVILQMPNCPEILQAFQAVWKIGAVVVPINYLVGEEETGYIYKDSGAKVVISAPEYLAKVKSARGRAPEVKNIIMLGGEAEGFLSYSKVVEEASEKLENTPMEDGDLAALVYTSGTTGFPKGVMHTHYGLYYTALKLKETVQYPDDLTNLAVLPLCHSYGIGTMIYALLRPYGKTVIMRAFNLEQLFSNLQKYKVQSAALVPTMYVYMLLFPDAAKYDLSSVEYWICGSAPLAVETWNQFKAKFGGEIAEGWGLTEACANNSLNPDPRPEEGRLDREADGRDGNEDIRQCGKRGPAGPGGGNRPPGADGHEGVLGQAGGNRRGDQERLAPYRRYRLRGRGRLFLYHRSQEGHHHQGGREYLSADDRRGPLPISPRSRRRPSSGSRTPSTAKTSRPMSH